MTAVLLISPERWTVHAVSKHHYARELVRRGHSVLFCGPSEADGGIRIEPAGDAPEALRVLRAPRVAPGLRFLPAPARRALEARWLVQVERAAGHPIDIVWNFENSRFFDLRFAGDRLKIYHQVDLNQDFHPLVAARTADVCLCTTDIIRERLRPARREVHKIHHATVVPNPAPEPEDFGPGRTHAVCIGNLDIVYLDVEALGRLVVAHPDVLFHFVGSAAPEGPLRRCCGQAANVRFWGKQPFQRIPALLAGADVLLVAYRAEPYRDQLASPHKFMEYFLSGRVVVCSYTDEYKDKTHLVEMAGPDEAIDGLFARVLADLPTHNAPERVAARRAFALAHSYDRQLDRIARIVRTATGREI